MQSCEMDVLVAYSLTPSQGASRREAQITRPFSSTDVDRMALSNNGMVNLCLFLHITQLSYKSYAIQDQNRLRSCIKYTPRL